MTGTIGVIDLGSNSTNLLVVDGDGHEVERTVAITGMGRAMSADGRLDAGARRRVELQLETYAAALDRHSVPPERRRLVATAAARMMEPGERESWFDTIQERLGARPLVLSGHDEGRLAFRGALRTLRSGAAAGTTWLVVDIGGRSTELMWGDDEPAQVVSLDLGAVSLTEGDLRGDPPRPEELSNAVGRAADAVADALRDWPVDLSTATMVGIAGTIVTAAAVEIGLPTFDADVLHGFTLTRAAAEDVFRTLATESLADRVHNPGLPADRADVIVGGLCILVATMRTLRAPALTVSVHNLLDGVAADVAAAHR